jgi:hypothetical protein
MSDANLQIPEEAKRAERAEKALTVLKTWNGYAPTSAQQQDLDSELDRRLAQLTGP